MAIEAKVAKHLSEYEVALTKGTSEGVAHGDRVTIYESIEVVDPDSGEPLGIIRKPFLRMQIVETQERLSVAKSDEFVTIRRVRPGSSAGKSERIRKRITSDPEGARGTSILYVPVGCGVTIEPEPETEHDGDPSLDNG